MTKGSIATVAAFLLAGGAALHFFNESSRQKNRAAALEERLNKLEQDLEETRDVQAQVRTSESSDAGQLKTELMRLRNEVTQRRNSGSVAEKLEAENKRLTAENRDLRKKTAEAVLAVQQAGANAAPEAAAAQNTAAAGASDPLAFYRRNPELMKRYFPQLYESEFGTNAVRSTPVSAGADANGVNPQGDANAANDPLAFYRRNPELMKRYFPNLAAGEPSTNATPNAPAKQ